jgi:hypothetical protein
VQKTYEGFCLAGDVDEKWTKNGAPIDLHLNCPRGM